MIFVATPCVTMRFAGVVSAASSSGPIDAVWHAAMTTPAARANTVLRARLNLQGTRLGFSTERDDSWWWLMVNGDLNAVRMLLAVMQRPGWLDDVPRLATGALQRQHNGRWSTTTSNAWGTLALEAFSRRFE